MVLFLSQDEPKVATCINAINIPFLKLSSKVRLTFNRKHFCQVILPVSIVVSCDNSDIVYCQSCSTLLRFAMSIVGYGLGFAVTGFAGNLYLNIFLMNAVSIPAKVTSMFFTDR